MFFAGIEKVLNPEWSASRFLNSAQTFSDFYAWFALPGNTWWVDPLNAWGITLIGVALLLGVCVTYAGFAGAFLMILYYFPHVSFPFILEHGFIVEEHIIYAAAFILIALLPEAERFGIASFLRRSPLKKVPFLKHVI